MNYLVKVPSLPAGQADHREGELLTDICTALENAQRSPQSIQEEDFKGIGLFVDGLAKGIILIQNIHYELMQRFIVALLGISSIVISRSNDAFHVLSSLIILSKTKLQNLNVNALSNDTAQRVAEFLQQGQEEAVIRLIHAHADFIGHYCGEVLDRAGCRSENMLSAAFEALPARRNQLLVLVETRNSTMLVSWVKNHGASYDVPTRTLLLSRLLTLATKGGDAAGVYDAIQKLGLSDAPEAQKAIENHFDSVLNVNKPLSVENNLYKALLRMKQLAYKPTQAQRKLLNEGWASIDQKIATQELRDLIRDVLEK